jgi:hypothetical protein
MIGRKALIEHDRAYGAPMRHQRRVALAREIDDQLHAAGAARPRFQ